jgi:hypothetical protein
VKPIEQNFIGTERPVIRVAKRGHSNALEVPLTRKMPKLEPIRRDPNFKPITTLTETPTEVEPEPEREKDFWPDFLTSKVEFLLNTFEKSFENISRINGEEILMRDFNLSLLSGQIFRSILQNAKQFHNFAHLQR